MILKSSLLSLAALAWCFGFVAQVPPPAPTTVSVLTRQTAAARVYSSAPGASQKWKVTADDFRPVIANGFPGDAPAAMAQDYVSGYSSRNDYDGVAVHIVGPLNVIANPHNRPLTLMRWSRDAAGSSRNGAALDGVRFSGPTIDSLFRNEGYEAASYRACVFEAGAVVNGVYVQGDSYAVALANERLPGATDAIENRTLATNSGHTFTACTFLAGKRGSVLIRGCVTEVEFVNCWFSGNGPALVIEDAPDEPNRWNQPMRITLTNCVAESAQAKRIILRGVPRSEVTLAGWSAGVFVVED